jgi:hypothetical protein
MRLKVIHILNHYQVLHKLLNIYNKNYKYLIIINMEYIEMNRYRILLL